jgi:H+/Cl- antiporter ClcA
MANPTFNLFLGIGLIFGFLAALMVYLITYNEWLHHYPTKKKPRKMALEAAIFAFIFFFLMSLFSGYILINFINK